jgi:16S rRNA (guanine527-N7)-methyltransferase
VTESAEAPPPCAAELFADRFGDAQRYVALLATIAIERGLIGPHEVGRLWTRHLLNSAALAPLIAPDADVLDLGSGAGLPGIPLALARPDIHMTLVEPMARRVTFLLEVVAELGIDVAVVRARAEDLAPAGAEHPASRRAEHAVTHGIADVVVARALAPMRKLAALGLPLLRPGGRLLALKGVSATAEIADARTTLAHWPGARIALRQMAAGRDLATVVTIDLDECPRKPEDHA